MGSGCCVGCWLDLLSGWDRCILIVLVRRVWVLEVARSWCVWVVWWCRFHPWSARGWTPRLGAPGATWEDIVV